MKKLRITECRDLGTIELTDKVTISDPCYDDDTWCIAEFDKVKPGTYKCQALLVDEGDWGIRVAELTVAHEDNRKPINKLAARVGVDSGQMGIYDNDYFSSTRNNEEWYKNVCQITIDEDAGCLGDKAVVSSSGYGDGMYDVLVAKEKGIITGIKVKFI